MHVWFEMAHRDVSAPRTSFNWLNMLRTDSLYEIGIHFATDFSFCSHLKSYLIFAKYPFALLFHGSSLNSFH